MSRAQLSQPNGDALACTIREPIPGCAELEFPSRRVERRFLKDAGDTADALKGNPRLERLLHTLSPSLRVTDPAGTHQGLRGIAALRPDSRDLSDIGLAVKRLQGGEPRRFDADAMLKVLMLGFDRAGWSSPRPLPGRSVEAVSFVLTEWPRAEVNHLSDVVRQLVTAGRLEAARATLASVHGECRVDGGAIWRLLAGTLPVPSGVRSALGRLEPKLIPARFADQLKALQLVEAVNATLDGAGVWFAPRAAVALVRCVEQAEPFKSAVERCAAERPHDLAPLVKYLEQTGDPVRAVRRQGWAERLKVPWHALPSEEALRAAGRRECKPGSRMSVLVAHALCGSELRRDVAQFDRILRWCQTDHQFAASFLRASATPGPHPFESFLSEVELLLARPPKGYRAHEVAKETFRLDHLTRGAILGVLKAGATDLRAALTALAGSAAHSLTSLQFVQAAGALAGVFSSDADATEVSLRCRQLESQRHVGHLIDDPVRQLVLAFAGAGWSVHDLVPVQRDVTKAVVAVGAAEATAPRGIPSRSRTTAGKSPVMAGSGGTISGMRGDDLSRQIALVERPLDTGEKEPFPHPADEVPPREPSAAPDKARLHFLRRRKRRDGESA